jgi:hypothetical protein
MQRAYQKIPYPLGTEEWKSFLNFAKTYYKEAVQIAKECCIDLESYRALLSATISPLVYIWEQWQIMTSDKKLPYATEEYKKFLEKIVQESQKIADQIGGEKGLN